MSCGTRSFVWTMHAHLISPLHILLTAMFNEYRSRNMVALAGLGFCVDAMAPLAKCPMDACPAFLKRGALPSGFHKQDPTEYRNKEESQRYNHWEGVLIPATWLIFLIRVEWDPAK